MPNQKSLVLKISTFLITENKLNIYSSFSEGTVFQGIHQALIPKGKPYVIEKCQFINVGRVVELENFISYTQSIGFRKRLLSVLKSLGE